MTEPTTNGPDDSSARQSVKLRRLGAFVLIAGLFAATAVYWLGSRQRDFGNDAATAGFYKPQARQMGMLYGQMGVMMDDLIAALKRPGVQAGLIIGVAALFCLVCFHLARPVEPEFRAAAESREKDCTL